MTKKLLFSVTKKDLVIEYFSGTGAGGQYRNKHQNSCRCKHPPSGAIGICQDQRSKTQNTKIAFRRMVESETFQKWLKIEASRVSGDLQKIKEKVEKELKVNIKEEIRIDGKWTIWENKNAAKTKENS